MSQLPVGGLATVSAADLVALTDRDDAESAVRGLLGRGQLADHLAQSGLHHVDGQPHPREQDGVQREDPQRRGHPVDGTGPAMFPSRTWRPDGMPGS
jgi:hypothetical protein